MKREPKPLACVLGDLDLVRPLGMAGIRCAVVAAPGSAVIYSRFVDHVIEWDGDWADGADLVNQLLLFASGQREPPILFYQHDEHALFLSRHRQRLRERMRFVIASAQQVSTIIDKTAFHNLTATLGLPLPATIVLNAAGEPPKGLRYPLVLKPGTRSDPRWITIEANAKALRVDGPDQLSQLWPRLAALGGNFVLQEVIHGSEDRICSYHVYVDDCGEIAGEFTGRKLRTRPREFGHTTALVITHAPDVAELGRRVVCNLDLRGVAKVDFKRDPGGRLWLLEVNPRFNLWHHAGAVAGVNLPALVWADLAGRPRPRVDLVTRDVTWCHISDFAAAREHNISLARWLVWAATSDTRSNVAWDDPVPVLRRAFWGWRHRAPHQSAPVSVRADAER